MTVPYYQPVLRLPSEPRHSTSTISVPFPAIHGLYVISALVVFGESYH